jgi:hypothetical protein
MRRQEAIVQLSTLAKTSRTTSTSVEAVFTHVKPGPFLIVLDKALVLSDEVGLTSTFRRYQDISAAQFIRIEYEDIQRIMLADFQRKVTISSTSARELTVEFSSLDDIVEFQRVVSAHGNVLREVNQVVWSRPNSFAIGMVEPPVIYGELYMFRSTAELKRAVYERGLSADARLRGWLLMLELIPRSGDKNESAFANRRMLQDYTTYRRQWRKMTDEQKLQNRQLAITVDQIDKDLPRLCEWLQGRVATKDVQDILVAYAIYDADTNYAQGMADLVAAILTAVKEKHLAFAVLKQFMRHYRGNFTSDGITEVNRMTALRQQLAELCPELPFCWDTVAFPWLLLLFVRQLQGQNFFRILDMYLATFSTEFVSSFAATVFRHARPKLMELQGDYEGIYHFFEEYWKRVDFDFLFALFKAISHKDRQDESVQT